MSNHPNRSKRAPSAARNPTPAEIRAAREAAGLNQEEAALLIHHSPDGWRKWEAKTGASARGMHPGLWELFRLKTGQLTAETDSAPSS